MIRTIKIMMTTILTTPLKTFKKNNMTVMTMMTTTVVATTLKTIKITRNNNNVQTSNLNSSSAISTANNLWTKIVSSKSFSKSQAREQNQQLWRGSFEIMLWLLVFHTKNKLRFYKITWLKLSNTPITSWVTIFNLLKHRSSITAVSTFQLVLC